MFLQLASLLLTEVIGLAHSRAQAFSFRPAMRVDVESADALWDLLLAAMSCAPDLRLGSCFSFTKIHTAL